MKITARKTLYILIVNTIIRIFESKVLQRVSAATCASAFVA